MATADPLQKQRKANRRSSFANRNTEELLQHIRHLMNELGNMSEEIANLKVVNASLMNERQIPIVPATTSKSMMRKSNSHMSIHNGYNSVGTGRSAMRASVAPMLAPLPEKSEFFGWALEDLLDREKAQGNLVPYVFATLLRTLNEKGVCCCLWCWVDLISNMAHRIGH